MATLKVHYGAWVLVGDGKRALLLHNDGDAELLNLRRMDVLEPHASPSAEEGSAARGHGVQPGSDPQPAGTHDPHQVDGDRFVAAVAEQLNHAAYDNAFKEIIIVAPPKMLAELRRDLSAEAQRKVVAEIPKDLTHHPIPEIEKLLPSYEVG